MPSKRSLPGEVPGNDPSVMIDTGVEEGRATSDAPIESDAKNEDAIATGCTSDNEVAPKSSGDEPDWDHHPTNPRNWSAWKKTRLIASVSSMGFTLSAGTSILSPAHAEIMEEFNVNNTTALVPLVMYVFALGLGPVVGGPLSETFGRRPIYLWSMPLGAFFTLGAGFTYNFIALCFLRFMAGLFWAPLLAVPSAMIQETFAPKSRGLTSAVFIMMPFLGPALGPVIGSFVVSRKGWRWTQWTLLFFTLFCMIQAVFVGETFNPILKRRLAKRRGEQVPPQPLLTSRLTMFTRVALIRPVHMMLTEPIVTSLSLYVSVNFGIIFSFFAGVPYTFTLVYHFSFEQSGLVFVSIAIGCCFGLMTILLCDTLIYRKKIAQYLPSKVPPEHRLYPAMISCFGLPIGLFWFAWTARSDISWAISAASIIVFAWGNFCVFVSSLQYTADTYVGNLVASAVSANNLARYAFAGAFPLFTNQMYRGLGINWATSLLGFISVAMLPIPWVLFEFGPRIRAKSKYETVDYS